MHWIRAKGFCGDCAWWHHGKASFRWTLDGNYGTVTEDRQTSPPRPSDVPAGTSATGRVQPANPIIGEGSDGGRRPATDDPELPVELKRFRRSELPTGDQDVAPRSS